MSDAAHHIWDGEGSPIAIEYSLVAIEEIRQQAAHGLAKLSRVGIETGGVLYGSGDGRRVRIEAMRPIASSHAAGPSFVLSLADRTLLEQQLVKDAEDPALRKFRRVGWFISRTRGELAMNDSDREIFSKYFPETGQVTLLIRPGRMNTTKGVFFVREPDGSVHESSREFDFPDRLVGRSAPARMGRVAAAAAAAATPAPVPMPVPMSLHQPVTLPEPVVQPDPVQPEPVAWPEPVVRVEPEPVPFQPDAPPPDSPPELPPTVIAAPVPQAAVPKPIPAPDPVTEHTPAPMLAPTPETKIELPQRFEDSAFSPLLVPAQPSKKRMLWIGGGAAALIGIVILATAVWRSAPPEPLGLTVTESDGQLQIGWNAASKSVQAAKGGSLSILDGSSVQRIALSRDKLSKGHYLYEREGGDVEVRMEVDGDGEAVRESSRFLGRAPVPESPAPVPAARAPVAAPAASGAAQTSPPTPAMVEENRRLKTENGKLRERIQQLERTQRILESRIGITASK